MNPPKTLTAVIILLAASACAGLPRFVLSSVLPNPTTPGEQVTAFGTFPSTITLTLEQEEIPTMVVPNGVTFTVPEDTVAGTLDILISAGNSDLHGVLQVIPRIDTLPLEGDTITVHGAGWPPTPDSTSVTLSVNTFSLNPIRARGSLTATLPSGLPYGNLTVRVHVGDETSAPTTLQRQAGTITGTLTFPAGGGTTPTTPPTLELAPESRYLVVGLEPNSNLDTNTLEGVIGMRVLPGLNAVHLSLETTRQAQAARSTLQGLSSVRFVEYDATIHLDNPTSLTSGSPASPGEGQWHLNLTGVKQAWSTTGKGAGTIVAVLDTGVHHTHPDLEGNLLPGFDFVNPHTTPNDTSGHGTHVAGLIAADGLAQGVAPHANLLPVRVLEGESGGSAFTVAQGILWAAGLHGGIENPNPAHVINLSLGTSSYSQVLAEAVNKALEAGVVVVAATGNTGGTIAYPAALPGVISVTALAGPTLAYQPWYANRGPGTWVTAYGGDTTQDQDGDGVNDGILSTEPGGYGLRMGTSMASPQVAGLAALALTAGVPASLVRDALAGTTTDLGVMGLDTTFGHGLATGRVANTAAPRTYVLARNQTGDVVAWTLAQADLTYTLTNLPPQTPLEILAATDEDGDGILAEAGELRSPEITTTVQDGTIELVGVLGLLVADGSSPITLEATPE